MVLKTEVVGWMVEDLSDEKMFLFAEIRDRTRAPAGHHPSTLESQR